MDVRTFFPVSPAAEAAGREQGHESGAETAVSRRPPGFEIETQGDH